MTNFAIELAAFRHFKARARAETPWHGTGNAEAMTETEPTPAPASPLHQCYERTFALLSKLAAGALVQVDPEHVQEFLAEIEHAHRLLRDAQLDRWMSAPRPEVYPEG